MGILGNRFPQKLYRKTLGGPPQKIPCGTVLACFDDVSWILCMIFSSGYDYYPSCDSAEHLPICCVILFFLKKFLYHHECASEGRNPMQPDTQSFCLVVWCCFSCCWQSADSVSGGCCNDWRWPLNMALSSNPA